MAYLGTVFGMNAAGRKNHRCLVERDALLGGDEDLLALAAAARITTFCLVGAAATGEPLPDTAMVFCEGAHDLAEDALRAVLARAGQLLGAKCVLLDRRALDMPTFEIVAVGRAGSVAVADEPTQPDSRGDNGLQCEIQFDPFPDPRR